MIPIDRRYQIIIFIIVVIGGFIAGLVLLNVKRETKGSAYETLINEAVKACNGQIDSFDINYEGEPSFNCKK